MTQRSDLPRLRSEKILLGDLLPVLDLSSGDGEELHSIEILRIAPVSKARQGDLVFVEIGRAHV